MIEVDMELLNSLFELDPSTGLLTWKRDRYARKVKGTTAGWVSKSKSHKTAYINIRICGRVMKAHRVVWFMHYGWWPEFIDHIDGDGTNNSILNLRSVSIPENMKNRPRQSNNSSGTTGVSFIKRFGKWRAGISVSGKRKTIGYFINLDEAVKARKEAEIEFGYHKNHDRAEQKS